MTNPVLVALDFDTSGQAVEMANAVKPYVGGFKVGLELLMSEGPEIISDMAGLGLPVFVDAKLHDIPNTVSGAARALASQGARWVTVHGAGGAEMVEAAVNGLSAGSSNAGALVVTVLTSLDETEMAKTGIERSVADQVAALASLAAGAGAEGVICSPHEVPIAKRSASGIVAVTPGIRPAGGAPDDQRRVATPAEALALGADYVVIGRPITRADDPPAAAKAIAESLK